jgi:hypothetical protein
LVSANTFAEDLEPTEDFLAKLYVNLVCPVNVGIAKGYPEYEYCLTYIDFFSEKNVVKFTYQFMPSWIVNSDFESLKIEKRKEFFKDAALDLSSQLGICKQGVGSSYLKIVGASHLDTLRAKNKSMIRYVRKNSYLLLFYFDNKARKTYIAYLSQDRKFYYKEYSGLKVPLLSEILKEGVKGEKLK